MKIIGHRGAKGLAPENTLAGLGKALEHHADEIEFDVRVSKDGQVVLAHDSVVHDAAGGKVSIASHTPGELRTHSPDLATLSEALAYVNAKVPLAIEIKPDELIQPIITTLTPFIEKGLYGAHNLHFASFSQRTLVELHEAFPDIPLIVNEKWSGIRASWRAKQLNTKRITMNQRWLWRGFITLMARRGWQLSAYTVNNPAKARRWAKYGLYGIVTDFPDHFKK
jgi:glycerophosphoryl diester phosphodiesterase